MDTLFLARADQLAYLGEYSHPREAFITIECLNFHVEARAQLYSILMNLFYDEARELEVFVDAYEDDGPGVWQLCDDLVMRLADLDEDDIQALAEQLPEYDLLSQAELTEEDVSDFLFPLVTLARNSLDEPGLKLYVLTR